jgi:circadian clock protein KaiC
LTERLSSGVHGLDVILGGGVPTYGIALIAGEPGTGKTILAQHVMFHNATAERPALYCSTVSEPLDKIVRFGQTIGFFDARALGSSVFFEDLGEAATEQGLDGVATRLQTLVNSVRPGLVVIDSFKALASFAADAATYRRFLHVLAGRLTILAVSTLLVGEYTSDELISVPEAAVADTIFHLATQGTGFRRKRYIEVVKMRGGTYASGRHAFRITDAGLEVFPRLADPLDTSAYVQGADRVSTGVPLLDDLLHDGFWRGSASLVAGPTGTGKTLLGLHFLFRGAVQGEPGVLATLQESKAQLDRILAGYGWSLDEPAIHLFSRSPVGLLVDEWMHAALELARQVGARRLVVDSMDDVAMAMDDETRLREYMYSLVHRCSRLQISLLITHELPDLFDVKRLSEFGVSHLADNVLLLQYLPGDGRLRRAVTVLKTRASAHEPVRHEYTITRRGIELVARAVGGGETTPRGRVSPRKPGNAGAR